MKSWWKSKTLWLAILQILMGIVGQQSGTTDSGTTTALIGSGVATGALRLLTTTKIKH